jgi:hypothetical protein
MTEKGFYNVRDYVLFKEWLQKQRFSDIDPRKEIDH